MAGRSLLDDRDTAVIAYDLNYFSDVEFSLLQDNSRSKAFSPTGNLTSLTWHLEVMNNAEPLRFTKCCFLIICKY